AEPASPAMDGPPRAPQGGGEQHGIPLWAHLLADPGFAPEHAARAAVRALGPQAAAWVAAVRERYPSATPDGIARLAARELTRDARRLGAATPGGGPAVLATAGVVATAAVVGRTQARLVLTI